MSQQMKYFNIKEHKVPACHIREYPGCTATSQEDVLYLHVKQYLPKTRESATTAITVIAAHGIGFPKEIYEPLWDDLYEQSTGRGYSINGVWIVDVASQGMSGVLNESKLSDDFSWMDHPRDLLLVINQFRDEMPRPIVGIGHSFGGCHLVNLAYMHPRLFTTLILLDPAIQLSVPPMGMGSYPPGGVNFSTHRQDIWQNRATGEDALKKMFKGWDPRVMDRMLQYGLRELPTRLYPETTQNTSDPPVTLTTTKLQESIGLLRENFQARQPDGRVQVDRDTHPDMDPLSSFLPMYRPEPRATALNLPSLRPSTLWILGDKTFLNLDELREGIKTTGTGIGGSGGIPENRVQEKTIKGTHFFPCTAVKETSALCASWLGSEMDIFRNKESKWIKSRAEMTQRDHLVLNRRWIELVKPFNAFKNNL